METIGLLSGIGHLPVDVALSAKSMGYRVIAVGVVPDIDPVSYTHLTLPTN